MTAPRRIDEERAIRRMHLAATIAGRAACAGMPHHVFFPTGPTGRAASKKTDPYAQARQVCGRCPVRQECLELSDTDPQTWGHGMFGGLTPDERRTHRRKETPRAR